MYIAASQRQTTPGDKILMSTETSCHFSHLLEVSKKSLWSLILYNFVHDFIHVYTFSPGAGADSPPGDKVLMSTEMSCHFIHLMQVLKKCLWSLILYNLFYDLIHVYSPGIHSGFLAWFLSGLPAGIRSGLPISYLPVFLLLQSILLLSDFLHPWNS